jgi:hypothetical protein
MIPVQSRLFWLTLIVIVTAVIIGSFDPKDVDELPDGFESPVLALELAQSADDAALVIDGDQRRAALKKATYFDFAFILVYTFLWFVMGRRVSPIVAIVAVLAGLADLIENTGMLITIAAPAPSLSVIKWTYYASLIKWLQLGLVFIALFFYFRPHQGLRDGWDVARLAAGLAYAYSGILCVAGVFVYNPVIERSVLPLSVALTLQLILSLLAPSASGKHFSRMAGARVDSDA